MSEIRSLDQTMLHFLFQPSSLCKDYLISYLNNSDIVRLDSAISDISLRKLFNKQVGLFYEKNDILSADELEWILRRNIPLTTCRVARNWGNILIILSILLRLHIITCLFIWQIWMLMTICIVE